MNKLTMAAGILAYASAIQMQANLEAEDVFDDIAHWFENDFVDFWEKDVGGALEDVGDWFANDFADWWKEDFVDFWTEDFPDAMEDVGDWFKEDVDHWFKHELPDTLETIGHAIAH